MPTDFNQQVIEEFRANGGRVGGPFEGARLLLLTTVGARSGAEHTVPLGCLPDGEERTLVIASAGGAPRHPAWYHNLRANPLVTVEDGAFVQRARAAVLDGAERDAAFARAAEADPGWSAYQAKTERTIPVVALHPEDGPPRPASASPATTLKRLHDGFRRELALIREEIARTGPGLGTQLRMNCLTVCQGLRNHHTGEDAGLFPALGEQHPAIVPVLERLGQEHQRMASLVEKLREAATDEEAEPSSVLERVEELTERLERHLDYEEEQLLPLLEPQPT